MIQTKTRLSYIQFEKFLIYMNAYCQAVRTSNSCKIKDACTVAKKWLQQCTLYCLHLLFFFVYIQTVKYALLTTLIVMYMIVFPQHKELVILVPLTD